MAESRFEKSAASLVLAMVLVLSVMLLWAPGTSDVEMFLIWGSLGQQHGLVGGYQVMVDHWPDTVLGGDRLAGGGEYPPLGFAWLYVVCQLADLVGTSHFLMFKLGLLAFSFVSTGMLWLMFRSIALAAAFQGAIMLSAAGLGYTDVVPAPFIIGALWAFRDDRPVLGFVLLLTSVLLKWQPLIIAPFLLLYMLEISDLRSIATAACRPTTWLLGAVIGVIVLSVFVVFGAAPLSAFLWALRHPFLSANALNVAWLATFLGELLYSPQLAAGSDVAYVVLPPPYLLPFKLIFFILFAVVVLRFIRTERTFSNCLLFSILGVVTYGVWNSAVHENHWFIALVPAFILAGDARTPAARWIAVLVGVMFNVNLFVFYGITGQPVIARTVGIDLSVALSLVFVAIWFVLLRHAWSAPILGSRTSHE